MPPGRRARATSPQTVTTGCRLTTKSNDPASKGRVADDWFSHASSQRRPNTQYTTELPGFKTMNTVPARRPFLPAHGDLLTLVPTSRAHLTPPGATSHGNALHTDSNPARLEGSRLQNVLQLKEGEMHGTGREAAIRDAARVAGIGPALVSRAHLHGGTAQAPSQTSASRDQRNCSLLR